MVRLAQVAHPTVDAGWKKRTGTSNCPSIEPGLGIRGVCFFCGLRIGRFTTHCDIRACDEAARTALASLMAQACAG